MRSDPKNKTAPKKKFDFDKSLLHRQSCTLARKERKQQELYSKQFKPGKLIENPLYKKEEKQTESLRTRMRERIEKMHAAA